MTNSHKRWLTILSLVAIPALLYAVLAERASWRPRIWHVTLGHIQSVAFSPDGKLLAVGVFLSRQQPGAVFLWNIANSRVERHLDVPTAPVQTVAFAPTGQQLAASTN
ncbi:MAG: hypothetical protein JOZ57_14775, partial [Abitibacteriaceae bacterium]|nr:hypothetical protein [Abditibacteriaceae bacterium]